MATYDAGIVTAYGAAVRGGYTGTYEQFCAQQANYAASAAAVEQAKEDVEELIESIPSDYSQLEDDVEAMTTATASDVGKALKAKTVSGGKVTEWEFGEAGGGLTPTQRSTLMDIINIIGGAFTVSDAQEYIDAFNEAWNVTVTGIRLNKSTLTFNSLTSDTLIATLIPPDATGTITWTSSNPAVATVNSNGTVVVVGNGTCTITASCGGYSATCSVTVSGIATTYTVTNTLTGCVTDNALTRVEEGAGYSATITPDDGYLLPFVSATITMGGNDITSTAWNNGSISIASVTGAIVITVSATQDSRVLVAKWDFTKSLIDSVGGLEMVLSNSTGGESLPTRDATGLHFTASEQLARCTTYSGRYADGRTIEFDVASADFAGDASKHKRLLNIANDICTLIYRNANALQVYNSSWKTYTPESGKTIPTTTNELSGKTVGVKLGTDKTLYLYLDGELVGTCASWTPASYAMPMIGFGGKTGETGAQGNQIHNMTITGLRVYEEAQ